MPACDDYLYPQGPTEMFLGSVLKDGKGNLFQNFCV